MKPLSQRLLALALRIERQETTNGDVIGHEIRAIAQEVARLEAREEARLSRLAARGPDVAGPECEHHSPRPSAGDIDRRLAERYGACLPPRARK